MLAEATINSAERSRLRDAMEYEFYTVDVFTDERFGGNQLAVIPDAVGLTAQQMYNIAREFNYSECSFVMAPVDSNNTKRVRILTPTAELPFAGHPNIGTTHVMARTGGLGLVESVVSATLEQIAGA